MKIQLYKKKVQIKIMCEEKCEGKKDDVRDE